MRSMLMVLILAVLSFAATVDINRASVKELSSLKGIGKKRAEAIVEYREKNCFQSVEELLKVKGIGKKTLEQTRTELEAGPCPAKEQEK